MTDDDRIRRLLSDARHDEPIPPDVARRLDGVLADLRADRPVRATVTDLAAARRRRRARALLVAAAAVVVAGIGIDQLRGASLSGGTSDSSAGGSVSVREQPAPEDNLDGGGAGAEASTPQTLDRGAVHLDSGRFARQVARLQLGRADTAYDYNSTEGRLLHALKAVRCRRPGPGHAVPVTYDGAPGVLVYRPATRDSQVVDLILCGHPGITRTITLPAP